MSDTTQTPEKRARVSDRQYIDSTGKPVDKIEQATGASYALLSPAGNKVFAEQFGGAGEFVTMCAIFGFHTKVGNVANTVLNNKDEPGTPDDAAAAIEEFIASAKSGTWAERAGGVGVRVDKDALADAIVAVASAAGKTADRAQIRAKLESDTTYARAARQVPAVLAEYTARVGKTTKSIDDLLS